MRRSNAGLDVPDEKQLSRYRRLLLAKRAGVLSHRATGAATLSEIDNRGDVADLSAAHSETEVLERLGETGQRLLKAIETALARLDQGAYGRCEACGRPISASRLKAVPWTGLCRDCKDQRTRR